MQKNKNKTKSKITAKEIIKYEACQHHRVSYRKMEELVAMAVKRSKKDAKIIADLTYRIRQDNWFKESSPGAGKVLINDIKLKHDRIKELTEERDNLKKELEENEEEYKDLLEKLRSKFFGRSYDALVKYALQRDKTKDN